MAYDPNDADTKAAVAKDIEEAIAGLQTKNTELLAKLKKAQKDATIDPADHAALQAELDATTAKLAEATKALKTATTEAEKAKKAYETESQVAHRLLVDNGLTEALTAAKVKPEYQKAAKALLAGQVVLVAEGDKRIAKVGDKALADFVTEWAKGEEGKHFVAAPGNGGGGAPGGGDGKGGAGKFEEIKDPAARLTAISAAGVAT
jgi:hypothetical protein